MKLDELEPGMVKWNLRTSDPCEVVEENGQLFLKEPETGELGEIGIPGDGEGDWILVE